MLFEILLYSKVWKDKATNIREISRYEWVDFDCSIVNNYNSFPSKSVNSLHQAIWLKTYLFLHTVSFYRCSKIRRKSRSWLLRFRRFRSFFAISCRWCFFRRRFPRHSHCFRLRIHRSLHPARGSGRFCTCFNDRFWFWLAIFPCLLIGCLLRLLRWFLRRLLLPGYLQTNIGDSSITFDDWYISKG